MTKTDLLQKLTGTEMPKFITEREDKIIDICLSVINNLEQRLQASESNVPSHNKQEHPDEDFSFHQHWKENTDPDRPVIRHFQS